MGRQKLPKKRSPEWLLLAAAHEKAIKDLRYAYQIIGVHCKALEAHNEYLSASMLSTGAYVKIGNSNLILSRDYIASAVDRLRIAVKGCKGLE